MVFIFRSHDPWWSELKSLWLLVNIEKNGKNKTCIRCLTLDLFSQLQQQPVWIFPEPDIASELLMDVFPWISLKSVYVHLYFWHPQHLVENYLTVQLCNNMEKCSLLFISNSLPDNFIVYVSSWLPMLQEIQVFPVLHNKFMQLSRFSKLFFPRGRDPFNLVSLHMENILYIYLPHCLSVLF